MINSLAVANKLQMALLMKGERLLITTNQFYSNKLDRPVNIYTIKKVLYDNVKQKNQTIDLFSTTSRLYVALYMRDYWYEFNGWEVPHDDPEWEINKQKGTLVKDVGGV